MTTSDFLESVSANLRFWEQRVQTTEEKEYSSLAAEADVILRALEYGLLVDEGLEVAARLALGLVRYVDAFQEMMTWIPVFEQLVERLEAAGSPLVPAFHNKLGFFYKMSSRRQEAEQHHRTALEIAARTGDVVEEMAANFGLSEVFTNAYNLEEADRHALRAMELVEQHGLRGRHYPTAHLVLGNLRNAQGRFEEAEQHLLRALAGWDDVPGSERSRASVLLSLATCVRSQGRLEESLHRFQEAIPLLEQGGAWPQMVNTLLGLGTAYFQMERYEEAMEVFKSIDLLQLEQRGYAQLLGLATNNLGNTYMKLGDLDAAADHLEYAIDIWRSISNKIEEGNSVGTLAETRVLQGRRGEALQLFDQAIALLENLQQHEFARRLHAKYSRERDELRNDHPLA